MLNPQDLSAIGTLIREFARDPREHAKTLAAIGRREGYEHIKHSETRFLNPVCSLTTRS